MARRASGLDLGKKMILLILQLKPDQVFVILVIDAPSCTQYDHVDEFHQWMVSYPMVTSLTPSRPNAQMGEMRVRDNRALRCVYVRVQYVFWAILDFYNSSEAP
ncbi:hypothetical protein MPER_14217 [Moniliophthora perniciosa FA553]|nr:hypothetical protein MPER_14217 [Moniliophthora perniciosa FA553]